MERSRTELLRDLGIDIAKYHGEGILFAITEANLKYRFPAKYDDLLELKSTITEVTSYRIVFKTDVHNQDGVLCSRGEIKMVGFRAETGKIAQLPDEMLAILKNEMNQ